MSGRGFDSGSDSDQEYDFVIDEYDAAAIEAKRDRDDLEGSDDDAGESERDTQRQRRLPSQEVQDLVQELDNLQEELRTKKLYTENEIHLTRVNGIIDFRPEKDLVGINYALGLFTGEEVDRRNPFHEISLDLLPKLVRAQELFRTFVPASIALYGYDSQLDIKRSAEYLKMVSNVMDYYVTGIEQEPVPYKKEEPRGGRIDRIVYAKIRENAYRDLNAIATITPTPRPYATYYRMYVDEYLAALANLDSSGDILNAVKTFLTRQHGVTFRSQESTSPWYLSDAEADEWFVLLTKFGNMLRDGPVLAFGEIQKLEKYFLNSRHQEQTALMAFDDVFIQMEEDLGSDEASLQMIVSALPEIGIDKERLRAAYQSPDADQSVFGELDLLEELTEPLVFHQFVRAHNKARATRDWIPRAQARYDYDPFARESGLDTVLFNLQALEAQVKSSLDRGQNVFAINPRLRVLFDKYRDKVDDLVAKYNYANNLRAPYLQGVVELFGLDEKPSMPQRASDEDNWDGPIEQSIFNLKNFMYGQVQHYKNVLQALDEALLGFQSAYPESSFTRYLNTYSLMLVKMLLFDGIKTEFGKFDFTSPRLNETFEAKSLNEIFETVEGRNWRNAFDDAIQTFVYVETGDSSFIKSKVARLQELAHNKALRKDAAKIAKCCGCCDGETARPSYMTDESFKKGPDHDNAEYAVVRQEVMDHLDARFDEDLAQMVELAMELKKLQIADEHADTLARIAVSQFAKRL
jgi:hypothetical protein